MNGKTNSHGNLLIADSGGLDNAQEFPHFLKPGGKSGTCTECGPGPECGPARKYAFGHVSLDFQHSG
jgi:hypothetical protein